MKLDIDKLDFKHCEDEPIHRPELIQSYGYLFAIDKANGKIKIISQNVKNLLVDNVEIIGQEFFSFLEDISDADFILETYERAAETQACLPLFVNFKNKLIVKGEKNTFYGVVYDSNGLLVIEMEPSAQFRETFPALHQMKLYASSIAPRFKLIKSLGTMAQEMVETIRYITRMDRVVLYKFHEDGSGKVLAESKIDGIESYLNLHYPAGDIPKQARELYKKNWIRQIANVNLEPSPLIPSVSESGRQPLDMTCSLLRDFSPIHKQYIRNQNIASSLSMSLVTHGDLWGMISCHSKSPNYIPQNIRLECENLSQLFSWHLYAKEEELMLERRDRTDKAIVQILNKTAPNKTIIKVFEENEKQVLDVLDADGFMFYSNTEQIHLGINPHLSVVKEIYEKHYANKNGVFYTEKLDDYIIEKGRLNDICGLLMMSIGGSSNNFTAWFRKEHRETQNWAGTPSEKSPQASKAERLTPRSSFEVHTREISGKSKDWDVQDLDVANRFNRVFMSYAFEKQELLRSDINYLHLQNKYINEFLATLAHELRNPLAPISTGLTLLEEVKDDDTRNGLMVTMKRQVDHMTTMIDDLMDISRITQNKVKLVKDKIDLRDILNDAIAATQPHISKNEHELFVSLPDVPIWVYGDNTRLNQVFVNILANAAKYTSKGGKIELRAQEKGKNASIRIKDNGLGLENEQLESIFTMFTQMNTLSSQSKSGLGIGLTLVKRLLELHNAEIHAYSDGLGMGSEFEVLIPLAAEPKLNGAHSTAQPSSEVTEKLRSILIVDDNEDLIMMLKILLEKKNYTVWTAYDGKSALENFDRLKPDFAIIDLGLPDMDGFELCELMKEKKNGDKTVYFSHSGLGDKEKVDQSARTGFKKHFTKPVKIDVLLNALKEYANI